ncbi:hypothetical protein F5X98DRAFT_381987 [Xylaria grammica]|nr:hypothetical protein F5X98DRAFT_381987 [Xylaria grammica]
MDLEARPRKTLLSQGDFSEPLVKTGHYARYWKDGKIEFVPCNSQNARTDEKYIPAKKMPLTPSLDIDRLRLRRAISGSSRKELLALGAGCPSGTQPDSLKPAPLTVLGKEMQQIWAEVLDIDETSITRSVGFRTLGGDIVLCEQLVITCRQRGIEISIATVLRDDTLTEICHSITPALPISHTRQVSDKPTSPSEIPSGAPIENAVVAQSPGMDRRIIEDVAEASPLQTMFVGAGTLEGHSDVDYLTVHVSGTVNRDSVKKACLGLAQAHPILRTAFMAQGRQLYQTVLRSFSARSLRADLLLPRDFGRPVTKFFYFYTGKRSILTIRLSKAQYGRPSLLALMEDLGKLYNNTNEAPRRLGFCEVIRAAQAACSDDTRNYWHDVLNGASITQVVQQPSLTSTNGLNLKTIHQNIAAGSLNHNKIPFEVILKGAWAVVLSSLSSAQDVVFGEFIDCRHLSLANGQANSSVVGPWGNIIPVRVQSPGIPVKPREYLEPILRQHMASNVNCNLVWTETDYQDSDILVRSRIEKGDHIQLSLNIIGDFSPPMIPLPASESKDQKPLSTAPVGPDQAYAIHKVVLAAWGDILNVQPSEIPELRLKPFYEIWGDLVPAAELAKYYTDHFLDIPELEGSIFTTEEIINHPTMMQQYELVIAKRQASRLRCVDGAIEPARFSWRRSIRRLASVQFRNAHKGEKHKPSYQGFRRSNLF